MKSRVHKASGRVERVVTWARHRARHSGPTPALATDLAVPDRLRVARELSGLSRGQAAAQLTTYPGGYHRIVYVTGGREPPTFTGTVVAAIEAGETEPAPDTMKMLAEIYDVPLEWLRGGPAPEWLDMLLKLQATEENKR